MPQEGHSLPMAPPQECITSVQPGACNRKPQAEKILEITDMDSINVEVMRDREGWGGYDSWMRCGLLKDSLGRERPSEGKPASPALQLAVLSWGWVLSIDECCMVM